MKLDLLGDINGVSVFGLSIEDLSICDRINTFVLHNINPDKFSLYYYKLQFRAVSYDKWENVKNNGIDVLPTDSVIYCELFEKAMEYGEWPKIMMGLDPSGLDRTFREVDANIDQKEINKLLKTYPVQQKSNDGSKIWLSRLSENDPRRATSYEVNYAKWIPGDPWKVLKIIILVDIDEREWII